MRKLFSLIAVAALLAIVFVGLSPPDAHNQKPAFTASVLSATKAPAVQRAEVPQEMRSADYKTIQMAATTATEVRPVARNGSYRDHPRTAYTYTYTPKAEVERDIGSAITL